MTIGRAPAGGAAHDAEADEREYLGIFERARQRLAPLEPWHVAHSGMWTSCEAPGYAKRHQGWKLHVSATVASVEEVLERSCEVLLSERATFKFARGSRQVRDLTAMRCERGAAGKIITVYPDDDDHFLRLGELLHEATAGLPGPAILSDRPYRPDSLVHYRYGSFTGELVHVTTEGSYAHMLIAPDGSWCPDERKAWFSPPPWAESPLPDTPDRPSEASVGKPVLLDGRFVVRGAIRHSNRGGVYRARDERTGEDVIIKQARPHVAGDLDGKDARDWMRHEGEMLDLLAPEGVTPAKVSLFDYQGHTFLAEQVVPGVSLREWAVEQRRQRVEGHPPLDDVVTLARRLVALVARVHGKGLVLRDLNPSNVILAPDGRVVLIDPEFLTWPGTEVAHVMTRGFAAPEQRNGPRRGPALGATADLYALGASLFYLCAAIELDLPSDDEAAERSDGERVRAVVRAAATVNPVADALRPLIEALLDDDPAQRPGLDEVEARLDGLSREPAPAAGAGAAPQLPPDAQERLLADSLEVIVDGMTPDGPSMWPKQHVERQMLDPCAVQGGAAGPVEVLRRALAVRGDERFQTPLRTATRWMADRLDSRHRLLPGLYFGRAGSAWALYEAATTLGESEIAEQAVDLAKRLPLRWFNPDVTHGLSGAGMAQLHLWRRTGDVLLRDRVVACAEGILEARERGRAGVVWPIPSTPPSALAGTTHYGFAHGVAGVSTFLLSAGLGLGRPEWVEAAREGARTLAAVAERAGEAVTWPAGEDPSAQARGTGPQWWCSGAGGIGMFLLRLWRATGDDQLLELAHGACVAVRRERWFLSPVHCHGVAGNGELLLDMAAATGDARYLEWAAEHAALLELRHASHDGRKVVYGESPQELAYSYSTGLAGVAAFLLRLRHGGPRCFMVDEPALDLDVAGIGSSEAALAGAAR